MQDLTNVLDGARVVSGIAGDKGLPFGAHIWGAYVVFSYFDPFADRVFVTGSFNGWSESTPMEKSRGGVWTATVPKAACPMRSTYKYKVYDGQEQRYVTDPYSEGTDGEPYHNSVVCKKDGYLWGDGSFLDANAIYADGGYEKMPLHVYELSLGGFFTHHIGTSVTYEVAARELSVYARQMGYTHVLLRDAQGRYFDIDRGAHSVAYYAPNASFGGADAFRRFVDIMHRAGIGVIVAWNFVADKDIYSQYEASLGAVPYWVRDYHVDGVLIEVCDRARAELADALARSVNSVRRDAAVFARGLKHHIAELGDCVLWQTDPEDSLLKYFRGGFDHRCASGLCDLYSAEALLACAQKPYVDELPGDGWRVFAALRTIEACRMTLGGKKATFMGREIAMTGEGKAVDWRLLDKERCSELQLCLSDLGELYLSHRALWAVNGHTNVNESACDRGVISFERTCGDERLVVVINVSVNVYGGHSVPVSHAGTYDEIFNSDSTRYGGSGVVNCGAITTISGEDEAPELCVTVPPLAAAIFKLRVQ